MSTVVATRKGEVVQNPPLLTKLLNDPRAGWLWFILRIWVGWQWFSAGIEKVSNPAWVQTGLALKGFWAKAVGVTATGTPIISANWYREFLQFLLNTSSYTWFGKLIAYGELLVGIGLILGAFTGIAALFAGLMNWSYLMAGTVSTNPVLLIAAIALIVAWKVSGYIGADYFILRFVGTPWRGIKLGGIGKTTEAKAPAGD